MIFCVEDDQAIRDLMTYTLNSAGFAALGFEDGTEFFAALEKKNCAAILQLPMFR